MSEAVYWMACSFEDLPDHDHWLGGDERAHLAALHVPKRRHDWRLGRWTAKQAVSRALDPAGCAEECANPAAMDWIQIIAADDGAPEPWLTWPRNPPGGRRRWPASEWPAGRPDVNLSLSHSGDRGFATASSSRLALGCDVERVEPRSETFIADFLAAEELPGLNRLSRIFHRDLAATLFWSAKESALKVLRTGLRDDTRSVLVDVDTQNGELVAVSGKREMRGWWWVDEGFVHTVLQMGARPGAAARLVDAVALARRTLPRY